MTKYWKLKEDMSPNRRPWDLGSVSGVNNWLFIGEKSPPHLPDDHLFHVELTHDGITQDYWKAGYASVPVVSPRARDFFDTLDGVTTLSARIGDHPYEGYAILFIGHFRDCLDVERSDFELFTKNDPIRPDRAGHIKGSFKLCIDPTRTNGSEIFRLSNGQNYIFVSDRVRMECLALQFEGCAFDPA